MISRAVLLALLAATAVLLVVSDASGSAADLTSEETLGRQIFFEGKGENGREITAVLGEGGAEIPAATLPCTGCHGEDGLGRPEGGLSPSNITWSSLTKPYGGKHPSGREHPPYTAFLAKRAVTMGLDAGGNRLHVAMPRYRLTHDEADALVAFVQRLGHGLDPGVSDAEVRIGVVLPPTAAAGDLGSAIRAVLEAAGARVNGSGGIYSRRIDLRFLEPPEPAKSRRKAVEDFLVSEDIFALVASFIAGADAALAELVREVRVPLVGPFSVHPQTGFPLNRHIFYLVSGFPEQARALVEFAARKQGRPVRRAIVVHPRHEAFRAIVEAIRKQGARQPSPWLKIEVIHYLPGRLDTPVPTSREQDSGTDLVFFLGSAVETAELLRAAGKIGWRPYFCFLGPMVGNAVLGADHSLSDRIFLSFPTIPTDTSPNGFTSYRELASNHRLTTDHLASQLAALAAFELLVEGLERSGHGLSREKLIASLEGLYQYPSAFTRVLTYGPNRRIGALGAYVVAPDLEMKKLMTRGAWIDLQ